MDNKISYVRLEENQLPTFTNSYQATGEIGLSGTKVLTGNKALADGQFSFVLKDEKGNVVREEVLLKREDLRLIAA